MRSTLRVRRSIRLAPGLLALMTMLTACATGMTECAARVRIVERPAVAGYEFLGEVTGTSPATGVAKSTGFEIALAELLDNAAALGATHVVLTGDRAGG